MKNYTHVWITGASSGLGRAFALELLKSTSAFTLVGRNLPSLQESAACMKAVNTELEINLLQADLTTDVGLATVCRAIEQARTPAGEEFYLLNAGAGDFSAFSSQDPAKIAACLSLNIKANTLLLRSISVRKSKFTVRIALVASHAAFIRVPSFAVYAASKAYLLSLGLTLRQELRASGFVLQVYCPGAVDTQFQKRSGIPKVLSSPRSPTLIARKLLSSTKPVVLTTLLDRILYILNGILPPALFDRAIFVLQKSLIRLRGGS